MVPGAAGLLFVAILQYTPFRRENKNLLTFDSSGFAGFLQEGFLKKVGDMPDGTGHLWRGLLKKACTA